MVIEHEETICAVFNLLRPLINPNLEMDATQLKMDSSMDFSNLEIDSRNLYIDSSPPQDGL